MRKALFYVIPSTAVTTAVMMLVVHLDLVSLVALMGALSGFLTMYLLYRLREKPERVEKLYRSELSFADALLPYGVIIVLSLLFPVLRLTAFSFIQFPGIHDVARAFRAGGRSVCQD